jgi:hypothetical protein
MSSSTPHAVSVFSPLLAEAKKIVSDLEIIKQINSSIEFKNEIRSINCLIEELNENIISDIEGNEFDQDDYSIALETLETEINPKVADVQSQIKLKQGELKAVRKISPEIKRSKIR